MAKKSWREKMQVWREPEVKTAPTDFAGVRRGQKMLITTPRLVEAFVRGLAPGDSLSVMRLRERLAQENGAEVTCPMALGAHLRVVAEAVFERLDEGAGPEDVAPVWRVLEPGTPTLAKVSFDPALVTQLRRAEGLDA